MFICTSTAHIHVHNTIYMHKIICGACYIATQLITGLIYTSINNYNVYTYMYVYTSAVGLG